MFTNGPSPGARLGVLGTVALVLALVFVFTPWLDPVKHRVSDFTFPVYWLTDLPGRFGQWSADRMISKAELEQQNETLRTELLIHKRKLQQMASLVAENTRLRQLLNSADTLENRVLVAEILGISPDPVRHKVMINRGRKDGVYLGQPVVDAQGLAGQVTELGETTSMVMLISDPSHALPVQINRNGVRLVAEGQGSLYELKLRHISSTTDIQPGDLLVTSGLGQRFPPGYPVAVVEAVNYDPGQPFIDVMAKPMAALNRNRHMLLVFDRDHPMTAPDP